MEKQIGLWIDHKKAVIVFFDNGKEVIKQIQSNLEKHARFRGGARAKTPYGAQFFTAETQIDRRFNEHLNKYYQQVISAIGSTTSILVFGSGEAKYELEKHLREKGQVKNVHIEAADKMTERQIAAKVRDHFQR
jgi:stalled ribosome rescue protein Dom34